MQTDSNAPSVYAAFSQSCTLYPNHPFLHVVDSVAQRYDIDSGDITYAEAQAIVEALIEHYCAAGYGASHRVGLMLDNRPAFIFHWFALNALSASVVPINSELGADEQAYLLDAAETCLLIYADEHAMQAKSAIRKMSRPIAMIDVGANASAVIPHAPKNDSTLLPIAADSECAILFTSGSTGQPKGCLLSNEYFLEMGRWYRRIGGLCSLSLGSERLITPLPLTHMNAMGTSLMAMVMTGGCIVQLDRFHPKSWWQSVYESRATVMHYLGVMPAMLLQLEPTNVEEKLAIKFGFGAGVNPAHHAAFEARFGFPLVEAWAMTETGTAACVIANREPRHVGQSCFGKPDPAMVEHRLVDEAGSDVERGDAGELLVRAAGQNARKAFFSGYHHNDAETDKAWRGGWWHTGDVVRELADGSLCFVDRRKNIIRRSGENIAALEVEAVLSRHPAIASLAVTPVPDEIRGEEVMACVVLNDVDAVNEHTALDMFQHCMASLAYFKTPGYIAFVSALPLTATQKPKRNEIKELAKSFLDGPVEAVVLFDLRDQKRKKIT
jgi:acyl-CoA synthetase (AMP-forming)/AMP-acid ligase II